MDGINWMKDARCASLDPDDFMYRGDRAPESRKANESRLKASLSDCEVCPVRGDCLEASSASDRRWTVRGGKLPNACYDFKGDVGNRRGRERQKECRNGHDDWIVTKAKTAHGEREDRECRTCRIERNRAARARKRGV